MLTSESSTARLAQGNLASKSGIADYVKKTDLNKHKLNELSQKVQATSTKRLTKDLINKFGILNEAKYFSSGIFQNYLYQLKDTLNISMTLLGLVFGNLLEFQMKILKR